MAAYLPGGRLHLQHGPIDLVIGANGDRDRAFAAARARFATVLDELVPELPLLRAPVFPGSPEPKGAIARAMAAAARPHGGVHVTPMVAVAGAVADAVLDAMRTEAALRRAYVNNGGDIALHLAAGESCVTAIAGHDGRDLGRIGISAGDGVGGIATSGRHGRSLSLGIADSVTVLAATAADADAAATMIANAVDLPGHAAVRRVPAREIAPDSDLGNRPVVRGLGPLTREGTARALAEGRARAEELRQRGLIRSAACMLNGEVEMIGNGFGARMLEHA